MERMQTMSGDPKASAGSGGCSILIGLVMVGVFGYYTWGDVDGPVQCCASTDPTNMDPVPCSGTAVDLSIVNVSEQFG